MTGATISEDFVAMDEDRLARVRHEVTYAHERVEFFRALMDSAGVDPSSIHQVEDIQRVPLTGKAHYRANFPTGVIAKGHSVNGPLVRRMQSSGTEGDRLISVTYVYNLAERMANCMSVNPRLGFVRSAPEIRTCHYAAPNCSDVECSNPGATMQDRMLPGNVLVLPVAHDLLTTAAPMLETAAHEIEIYAPNLLYVDPTHLAHLLRHLRAVGRPFPALQEVGVVMSFSLATQVARAQIQAVLGPDIPVAAALAMSEFGYLAMECDRGSMHLNTRDFYFEILDRNGQPAPGSVGELCVTTLGDELSPHIRYRTGDLVRPENCDCGSTEPAIRIEGRKRNLMRRSDGTGVTPRAVDDVVGPRPWIALYQLAQRRSGRFELRYVPSPGEAGAEAELRDELADLLGADVSVRRVEYIACERGGKFVSCKSELAEAELEAVEWQ